MQTETVSTLDVTYRTIDEVQAAMIDAGWSPQQVETIRAMLPDSGDAIAAYIEADEAEARRIKAEKSR